MFSKSTKCLGSLLISQRGIVPKHGLVFAECLQHILDYIILEHSREERGNEQFVLYFAANKRDHGKLPDIRR